MGCVREQPPRALLRAYRRGSERSVDRSIPHDRGEGSVLSRALTLRPVVFERQGTATPPTLIDRASVTPEYFDVLRMTLVRGRLFTSFDAADMPPVAIVNESMARTFWPGQDPIGQRVKLTRTSTTWTTIVGVVADARTVSIDNAHVPQIYSSLYQLGEKHIAVLVSGRLGGDTIGERVREQAQAIDPTLPVFGAESLGGVVSSALSERRFAMQILALFALTALILAGIGIYGVMASAVAERTREIAVRLVLGASDRSLVHEILCDGLRLAAVGGLAGVVLAIATGQILARSITAVPSRDIATLLTVPLLLRAVALVACAVPARRAVNIDPVSVIRQE